MKSRASASKEEKEAVVSDDDKPPTRSASTQSLKISVRNITARPAPYIHRDIDPRFDRTKIRQRPPRESRRVRVFRRAHYPMVTDAEWSDWRWQSRNRIKNLAQLENLLELSSDERRAIVEGGSMLPLGVTPYYVSLLDPTNPNNALRRTVIPVTGEFLRTPGEADDPLGEDGHSPVPGLVHRYPGPRVVPGADFCTTYCRYCTRSRVVGHGELAPSDARLEAMFDYIRSTPAIRDVLISGGDPLALGDEKLDYILGRLRDIPHVEFIRIGTKMPAVLPQRITPSLVRVLRKHHPIWMSVHFLHPDECTAEAFNACARLADAGIPIGSQTVLLKGVNDDVADDEGTDAAAAADAGAPRTIYINATHLRIESLPDLHTDGPRHHGRSARAHHRLRRADLRRRRAGRRRQVSAAAAYVVGRERRRRDPAQLRGPRIHIPRSSWRAAPERDGTMRIGLTYDLRAEYLALGYGEEETAEFDQQGTIDSLADAIESLGHTVDRIGSARALVNRLAKGDRWELVFNIAEGLYGYGREAQVPAILDVYGIASPLPIRWPPRCACTKAGRR